MNAMPLAIEFESDAFVNGSSSVFVDGDGVVEVGDAPAPGESSGRETTYEKN
jgi:hypothetical protein